MLLKQQDHEKFLYILIVVIVVVNAFQLNLLNGFSF